MPVLPPHLELSATAILDMTIAGADRFSARDMSYALAVIWLAQRTVAFDATNNIWRLPDNRLRAALGRTRRSGEDTEIARFVRLRDSTISFPDVGTFPLPTSMFRAGMPIRHTLDDEMAWVIDPGLLQAFKPKGDDDRARIPLALLAQGGNRFGVELTMKLLALHARGPGQPDLVSWEPDRFSRRMSLSDLYAFLGLPIVAPSTLAQKWIGPAIKDAWTAGITLDIELRRAATVRHPTGKVKDVVVMLQMPEPPRAIVEHVEPARTGWQTPPKFQKPRPAAPPANVVPFSRLSRPTVPSLAFRGGFVRAVKVPGDDDKTEIDF